MGIATTDLNMNELTVSGRATGEGNGSAVAVGVRQTWYATVDATAV